ncbi:hypothetical protein [Rhodococcus tibetensis]|uniref:Lycopene cyclase domain-containing protein n=1 Tax=Rhodococcus tibetensis TaxID=2965064 RepID=A0ABT1QFB0_9NOCA|nr:hypothetical protein [Rhodococcus sp. FXJ9.536]MCQ4120948.1 hypothetical protein [Rhodococcus sp. FXJ9.536]
MPSLFQSLVFMNLLFATTTLCLARPSRLTATATVVAAVLWIFGNGQLEGRILWVVTPSHGLTMSDLLSAAALLVAVWGFLEAGPRGPQRGPRSLLRRRL